MISPEGIRDLNSFIFTFRDNTPMKFGIKEENYKNPNQTHFLLYDEIERRLFVFGHCDIWIPKKGRKAVCSSSSEKTYEYNGIDNVLVGQSGWDHQKDRFDIKRIVVLQYV